MKKSSGGKMSTGTLARQLRSLEKALKRSSKVRQLFTLHTPDDLVDTRGSYLARTPEEVALHVGGVFTPREGGKCGASKDRCELGVCGTVTIPFHLFHEPNATEDALGAWGDPCYNLPGGGGILTTPNKDKVLVIREQPIAQLVRTKCV